MNNQHLSNTTFVSQCKTYFCGAGIHVVFLILICSGCKLNNQYDQASSITIIDFSELQENNRDADDLIESVQFIPLETTQECAISTISKLDFFNSTFYILSRDNLYLFDQEGKYIRQFAKQGRGPDEYTQAFDFSIDKHNKKVIIYDSRIDKMFIYDLSGNFIKSIPIGKSWQIEPTGNSVFLCYPMNIFGNQPHSLVVFNENGDTLKTFPNTFTFELKNNSPFLIPVNGALYQYDNSTCFKQFLSDTLSTFHADNFTLIPRYIFRKVNSLPLELLGNAERFNRESNNFSWLSRILETEKYLFLTLHNPRGNERVIYFKDQNMLLPVTSGNQDVPLNLSVFFWPRFKISEISITRDWQAINFKKHFKNVISDKEALAVFKDYGVEDFAQFYQSIAIDDNPIIQINTLK